LAQVGDATLSCIKTILTSAETDRLRFLQPSNDIEQQELENLKAKVSICFQSYTDSVKISEGGSKISYFPDDTKDCLEKQIGEEAFNQINSGQRLPTLTEKAKVDSCFNKEVEPVVAFQTKDTPLSKEIEGCLVLALGTKKASDVKKKDVDLSLADRVTTERCFGASIHPLQRRASFKIPEKVNNCLVGVLGVEREKELEDGHITLTEKEKLSGKKCFDDLNKVQVRLLPLPPQKIPFVDENMSAVRVISDKQDASAGFTLSGKALPGALVDIFIFSEPIVVSTEADANGDWVYKMTDPVSGGSHLAYAVTKDTTGRSVRSSIYNFTVLAAEESNGPFMTESKATLVSRDFVIYAILLVVSVIIILGFVIFLVRKNKKSHPDLPGGGDSAIGSSSTNTPQGNSENKITP
jgi:hypothetical protein